MTLVRKNLRCLKSLMLFITPFVTTLSISILPSFANTFASSSAKIRLNNFTINPEDNDVLINSFTNTLATNGQVSANANSAAAFFTSIFPSLSEARNTSFSNANGTGKGYFGLGESFAAIIAYDFFIDKNQTLAFDFDVDLDLQTSIDIPGLETATADGIISWELFDNSNGEKIDFFTVSSALGTPGKDDFLNYQFSKNISLIPSIIRSFEGTEELASASFQGRYSRTFANPTSLKLVEIKRNQTSVKANVPEYSSVLGLIGVGLLGFGLRTNSRPVSKI